MLGDEFCEKIYTDYNEALDRLAKHRALRKKEGKDPMFIKIGCRQVTDWCKCKEAS